MKKKLLFLAPTLLGMFLTSCGAGGTPSTQPSIAPSVNPSVNPSVTPSVEPSTNPSQSEYVTVKFINTSMQDRTLARNQTLQTPLEPTLEGMIFGGWYLDSNYEEKATFPRNVTEDLNLYARWCTYKEAFQIARDNTIGLEVSGYEFDYQLDVTVTYLGVGLLGRSVGNAKYDSREGHHYYEVHTNSEPLFYDGTKYDILRDDTFHHISFNENDTLTSYTSEECTNFPGYRENAFSKAVFVYDDEDIKEVKETKKENVYQLKTTFNASQGIAILGNYVNNPIIRKQFDKIPDSDVTTGMYVTFSQGTLKQYEYYMEVEVENIAFTVTYDMVFRNQGQAPTIVEKTFEGIGFNGDSFYSDAFNEVNEAVYDYTGIDKSCYDYYAKASVDFEGKNSIDTVNKGFAKHAVIHEEYFNDIYYFNDIDVSSDLENADLYKGKYEKVGHIGKVRLTDNTYHLVDKKFLGGYADLGPTYHTEDDVFYLLSSFYKVASYSFIQKISKDNVVTYSLGGSTQNAITYLDFFNSNLIVDAYRHENEEVHILPFGLMDFSTLKLEDFELNIALKDGVLYKMNLKITATVDTCYQGSRDFTEVQNAAIKLQFDLETNNDGSSFNPPSKISEL